MVKLIIILISINIISGCSTYQISKLSDSPPLPVTCEIKLYTDKQEAVKAEGEFTELCILTGNTLWSYDHTIAAAINRHKSKLCSCGATGAYIQAQQPGEIGVASVTLVGFRKAEK